MALSVFLEFWVAARGSFWLFRPGGGCLWLSATAEWFRTCDEVPQLRRGPATAEKFRYCGEDPALCLDTHTHKRSDIPFCLHGFTVSYHPVFM